MQRPFLGTRSASARLAFAFSFLFVLALFIAVALPSTSSATREASQVNHKQPRPEFVPGEALVRYRSERIAERQTRQAMVSTEGRQLSVRIERFDGSDIVPGLRIARVAADDTMAAIEALKHQPDVRPYLQIRL
jgi:hypothetical protein